MWTWKDSRPTCTTKLSAAAGNTPSQQLNRYSLRQLIKVIADKQSEKEMQFHDVGYKLARKLTGI